MRGSATAPIGTINAEGAVGGELSDTVAVRLSGLWQHRNDWIDNLDEPGKNDLEGYDDIAVRGQIQFKPTDALTLRLTGQYRDLDGDARIFRANAIQPGTNQLIGVDGGDFKRDEVRDRRPQLPEAEDPEHRRHDRI